MVFYIDVGFFIRFVSGSIVLQTFLTPHFWLKFQVSYFVQTQFSANIVYLRERAIWCKFEVCW